MASHNFSAPTRRSVLLGSVGGAAALLLAACGSSSSGSSASGSGEPQIDTSQQSGPYQGDFMPRTFDKPSVTLTDTSGKPFNLATGTAGRATLLYFGYTQCPDVCPTTMGDIAVAVSKLPKAQQSQIDVVFVSTDPEHDTPSVIRSWLNAFNPNFIGLTGDIKTIIAAAGSVGVYVAAPAKGQEPVHGAQTLGFLPTDNKAHLLYTSGTTSAVFAHDLPYLIKGVTA
ncbi:SCO family protein [Streptacidiphilus fuscans]|uniref:SCO family protein n=1 Tax=Streptacidiphilus fuscans TaxID=2789292 RepID=A0A931BCC8_9ACTN|nr:SCO family protein [Streptacidiphilus fuscans]MBF9070830.1 SCO family protein [Streptacidiphilus fuscans]